jgi:hypothetical protein
VERERIRNQRNEDCHLKFATTLGRRRSTRNSLVPEKYRPYCVRPKKQAVGDCSIILFGSSAGGTTKGS